MRIIHYIRLILGSFYDKNAYIHVKREERGLLTPLLIIVIAISSIGIFVDSYFKFNAFISEQGNELIEEFPEISIIDGIAYTNTSLPLIIENNHGTRIIIDSSKLYNNILEAKAHLLIRPDGMYINLESDKVEYLSFNNFNGLNLDPTTIKSYLPWVKWGLLMAFVLSLFLLTLLYTFISILLTIPGFIISQVLNAELDLMSIIRISTLALCPMIIIEMILKMIGIDTTSLDWFAFIIPTLFIYFGIKANNENINDKKENLDYFK